MHGHIGLDQGFEQGFLFRGSFVFAVFGHRVIFPPSPSDCARPARGRLTSFSVAALQLRINCLAGPLKHGGYLDDGLAGLEQVVQLFLFVGGPPPLRWS
jgi:hypothetical protein